MRNWSWESESSCIYCDSNPRRSSELRSKVGGDVGSLTGNLFESETENDGANRLEVGIEKKVAVVAVDSIPECKEGMRPPTEEKEQDEGKFCGGCLECSIGSETWRYCLL